MGFFAYLFSAFIALTIIGSLFGMIMSSFSQDDDSREVLRICVWVFSASLLATAIFLSGVFSGWYKP